MNFGWVDVEEGAGALQIHTYLPASVENFKVHGSRIYSIYSLAHLSWHGTCENELWMVDLGFLLPFPFKLSFLKLRMMNFGGQDFGFLLFSSHFTFKVSFSTTSKNKLWMVDLGFLLSLSLFPFKVSFPEASRHEF